jgi:hypothetical protein
LNFAIYAPLLQYDALFLALVSPKLGIFDLTRFGGKDELWVVRGCGSKYFLVCFVQI